MSDGCVEAAAPNTNFDTDMRLFGAGQFEHWATVLISRYRPRLADGLS